VKPTTALTAVAALGVVTFSPRVSAQAKHVPTIEESLSLRTIYSPKISPDGRFVVYSQRETNWKDNEFVNQLWLVNVSTGKAMDCLRY
jgi:Tol biopolymer transport system component